MVTFILWNTTTDVYINGKLVKSKPFNNIIINGNGYDKDIYIEEEDSVGLQKKSQTVINGQVNIAVVLLPYISNYTDFNVSESSARKCHRLIKL